MPYWYHARAVTHSSLAPGPEGQRQQSLAPSPTATVTATAAATGKQQRPAAAHVTRMIRSSFGISPPRKADGRGSVQPRRDCCQYCCHDGGQHPPGTDNCGITAQRTDRIGQPWTTRPLLRIRGSCPPRASMRRAASGCYGMASASGRRCRRSRGSSPWTRTRSGMWSTRSTSRLDAPKVQRRS